MSLLPNLFLTLAMKVQWGNNIFNISALASFLVSEMAVQCTTYRISAANIKELEEVASSAEGSLKAEATAEASALVEAEAEGGLQPAPLALRTSGLHQQHMQRLHVAKAAAAKTAADAEAAAFTASAVARAAAQVEAAMEAEAATEAEAGATAKVGAAVEAAATAQPELDAWEMAEAEALSREDAEARAAREARAAAETDTTADAHETLIVRKALESMISQGILAKVNEPRQPLKKTSGSLAHRRSAIRPMPVWLKADPAQQLRAPPGGNASNGKALEQRLLKLETELASEKKKTRALEKQVQPFVAAGVQPASKAEAAVEAEASAQTEAAAETEATAEDEPEWLTIAAKNLKGRESHKLQVLN